MKIVPLSKPSDRLPVLFISMSTASLDQGAAFNRLERAELMSRTIVDRAVFELTEEKQATRLCACSTDTLDGDEGLLLPRLS